METRATILIIDEESYLLHHFSRAAEDAGYHVNGTPSMEEGERLVRQLKPDVVLLNTLPPDGYGASFCKRIKADPFLTETSVMMLAPVKVSSGSLDNGQIDIDEYVPKPISSRDLLARMQLLLRAKKAEAQLANAQCELQHKHQTLLAVQKQLDAYRHQKQPPTGPHQQLEVFQPTQEEIYSALPVGYCRIDKYGLVMDANPVGASHLRTTRARILETLFPDYVIDEDVSKFFAHLSKVFETRTRQTCEIRVFARHGSSPRYLLLESIAGEKQENTLDFCHTTISDITRYKRVRKSGKDADNVYQQILKHLPEAALLTDQQGAFTFISPNVESVFGFSVEEIREIGTIQHLLQRDLFTIEEMALFGEIQNFEHEIADNTGETRILLLSVKLIDLEEKAVLYSCRDVTQYKDAVQHEISEQTKLTASSENVEKFERLEELEESEELLDSALETAPDIMYIYDLDEERTVSSYQQVFSFLGYTPQQIQAMGPMAFEKLLHPADQTRLELLRLQWAAVTDEHCVEIEYRLRAADGKWRWFRVKERVFLQEIDDKVTQIIGTAWDITEAKAEVEECKTRNQPTLPEDGFEAFPIQALLKAVSGGITLSDANGHFALFNPVMEKITGYTKTEANACDDFLALIYPNTDNYQQAVARIQDTLLNGRTRDIKTTIWGKDGLPKTLLVSTFRLQAYNQDWVLSTYREEPKTAPEKPKPTTAEKREHTIFREESETAPEKPKSASTQKEKRTTLCEEPETAPKKSKPATTRKRKRATSSRSRKKKAVGVLR